MQGLATHTHTHTVSHRVLYHKLIIKKLIIFPVFVFLQNFIILISNMPVLAHLAEIWNKNFV